MLTNSQFDASVEAPLRPGAIKHDLGKPRWDLIPPIPLEMVADVYGRGSAKYGDRNMEQGLRWGRVFRALVSHAWKWWRGEAHDPEDGQHHLASVVWCALTLMEYEIRGAGEDDRVPYPASTRRACPRDPREPSSPGASPGDPDPDPPPSRDPRQLELALPPLHTPTRAR